MSAEIKDYHGTPTLFLDGKPVFDGMMIDGYPVLEGFPAEKCAEYYRDAFDGNRSFGAFSSALTVGNA